MEDKKYPIYSIRIEYTEDINNENRKFILDKNTLPNSRIKDIITNTVMYTKEQNNEFIKQSAKEKIWAHFVENHKRGAPKMQIPIDNPNLESIEISLLRYESWCLTWFSHWTFDDGRNDKEFLQSFNAFVNHMERIEDYCLMGAEDRWRWHGVADDGETNTDPPCRCKYCKEKGIIRIDH